VILIPRTVKILLWLTTGDNSSILKHNLNSTEEVTAMKFKVLQIQLTDAEIDMVNEGVIVRKHTLKTYMFGKRVIPNATKALELGYYDHVLTVDGTNLEDVFYKGNFAHNHIKDIEVHDSFSSVSVGDVIVDENDFAFVVDTFGFEMLPEKIAA
jgi:hypothetical protein